MSWARPHTRVPPPPDQPPGLVLADGPELPSLLRRFNLIGGPGFDGGANFGLWLKTKKPEERPSREILDFFGVTGESWADLRDDARRHPNVVADKVEHHLRHELFREACFAFGARPHIGRHKPEDDQERFLFRETRANIVNAVISAGWLAMDRWVPAERFVGKQGKAITPERVP